MDKLIIEGGNRLIGSTHASGAKNAVLPLMAATLLAPGENTLTNVPDLRDIETFKKLLKFMGCKIKSNKKKKTVTIDSTNVKKFEAPYELVKTMRASILVLGPLVARFKTARVSLPGGCAIGARPINLHLMGLKQMGAEIKIEHGYIDVSAEKLHGAQIHFDQPTVTGTENLMLAAVYAEGTTTLENAAMEPEIIELARALEKMGAAVTGAGTDTIKITGNGELKTFKHEVISDRIEAGTLMIASAITRGNVLIEDCPSEHLAPLISKLKEAGTIIKEEEGGTRVIGDWPVQSTDIKTHPHPGFPTDMQAQMMTMMCVANGLSVITENIFENRFMHVAELKRMGAQIKIDGRNAIVKGVGRLSGAQLMATDLRASASLVLAGLVADGRTEISRIYHLDRGYERLEEKLKALGANIKRVKSSEKF